MVANYTGQQISLEAGKTVRLRASWRLGADGRSRSFTSYFEVPKGAPKEDISLEDVVDNVQKNFFTPLAAVQAKDFRWTRCVIQPDIGAAPVHALVFDPIYGNLPDPAPSDMEYVLNIVLEGDSQSRNLVLPGVSKNLDTSQAGNTYKSSIEGAESIFVNGLMLGKSLKIHYTRISRKDTLHRVRGASFQGFRMKRVNKP